MLSDITLQKFWLVTLHPYQKTRHTKTIQYNTKAQSEKLQVPSTWSTWWYLQRMTNKFSWSEQSHVARFSIWKEISIFSFCNPYPHYLLTAIIVLDSRNLLLMNRMINEDRERDIRTEKQSNSFFIMQTHSRISKIRKHIMFPKFSGCIHQTLSKMFSLFTFVHVLRKDVLMYPPSF